MNLSLKKIFQNKKLIFSVVSQVITLLVSILMTVGVTKYISLESYGYWQLFIFYCSYIGLAHFGICDGLYLTYGGKKMDDIDKKELKGVFSIFLILQLFASVLIIIYTSIFNLEIERENILYVISLLLIISNSQIFFGYILLATNKIVEYSKGVFIDKIILLILILSSIALNNVSLESLIFSFVLSKIISLVYLLTFYKSFIFSKVNIKSTVILDLVKNGGILMISNIVSTLILGVGRYFIDKNWNIEVFGKISLAISLVYFVLILLSQISFLLFPYLRNSSDADQKKIFEKLNMIISLILKISIVIYFPLIYVLKYFLPDYNESIHYLILLLPLCLYDGKMQILYTSYFKNLFLKKKLLIINILSLTISLIISLVGSYIFKDLNVILLGIVISVMLRSIVSEVVLKKKYNIEGNINSLLDLLFSLIIIAYFFLDFNVYTLIFSLLALLGASHYKRLGSYSLK